MRPGIIIYRAILVLAVVLTAASLVRFPAEAAATVRDSLLVCANTIIPTLFPLMCVSVFMVESGLAQDAGKLFAPIMKPLFNLPGEAAPALILGLIGGYPVGARTAIALNERGVIDDKQTEKLLAFCNNSGPAFILGTVGMGVFNDMHIGFLLYLAHILASLTVGVLFRSYGGKAATARVAAPPKAVKPVNAAAAFSRAVTASAQSMINICAFVIFFSAATRMLFLAGVIPAASSFLSSFTPLSGNEAAGLLTGLLEVASGVLSLKSAARSMTGAMAMAAFMLGWAGLSVHFQVISFLGEKKLKFWPYIAGKLCHGILSFINIRLFFHFFPMDMEAAYYLAERVTGATTAGFLLTLFSSLIFTFAILAAGALLSLFSEKC